VTFCETPSCPLHIEVPHQVCDDRTITVEVLGKERNVQRWMMKDVNGELFYVCENCGRSYDWLHQRVCPLGRKR